MTVTCRGQICVRSTPGQGTLVTLLLPIMQFTTPDPAAATPSLLDVSNFSMMSELTGDGSCHEEHVHGARSVSRVWATMLPSLAAGTRDPLDLTPQQPQQVLNQLSSELPKSRYSS